MGVEQSRGGDVATESSPTVAAVRALVRASRLLERASGELSLAQYRILSAIAAGDERASRIASRLALGKPTVSAAVDSLLHRGLLARSSFAADHRVAALALTGAGRELLERTETEMSARLDLLLSQVRAGAEVVQSLVRLGEAIEASEATRP